MSSPLGRGWGERKRRWEIPCKSPLHPEPLPERKGAVRVEGLSTGKQRSDVEFDEWQYRQTGDFTLTTNGFLPVAFVCRIAVGLHTLVLDIDDPYRRYTGAGIRAELDVTVVSQGRISQFDDQRRVTGDGNAPTLVGHLRAQQHEVGLRLGVVGEPNRILYRYDSRLTRRPYKPLGLAIDHPGMGRADGRNLDEFSLDEFDPAVLIQDAGCRQVVVVVNRDLVSYHAGQITHVDTSWQRDPPVRDWETGYQTFSHALIILANDNQQTLLAASMHLVANLPAGVENQHVETAQALLDANGKRIEHFGYRDGISGPLFFKPETDTQPSNWPVPSSPKLVVFPYVGGNGIPAGHGSYLVYRKLEQNVRRFYELEAQMAARMGNTSAELAGAYMVGRFRDGTPVVSQDHPGLGDTNEFDFQGDLAGNCCPLGAHIRKMNPRGARCRRPRVAARGGSQNLSSRAVP